MGTIVRWGSTLWPPFSGNYTISMSSRQVATKSAEAYLIQGDGKHALATAKEALEVARRERLQAAESVM